MLHAHDLTFESLEVVGKAREGRDAGAGWTEEGGSQEGDWMGKGCCFLRPLEVSEDEQCYGNLSSSCSNII